MAKWIPKGGGDCGAGLRRSGGGATAGPDGGAGHAGGTGGGGGDVPLLRPAPLREAFGEPLVAVEPITAGGEDPGLLTETFWAGLHGLATLMRSGRLPEGALLIAHFTGG